MEHLSSTFTAVDIDTKPACLHESWNDLHPNEIIGKVSEVGEDFFIIDANRYIGSSGFGSEAKEISEKIRVEFDPRQWQAPKAGESVPCQWRDGFGTVGRGVAYLSPQPAGVRGWQLWRTEDHPFEHENQVGWLHLYDGTLVPITRGGHTEDGFWVRNFIDPELCPPAILGWMQEYTRKHVHEI